MTESREATEYELMMDELDHLKQTCRDEAYAAYREKVLGYFIEFEHLIDKDGKVELNEVGKVVFGMRRAFIAAIEFKYVAPYDTKYWGTNVELEYDFQEEARQLLDDELGFTGGSIW